MSDNFKKQPDIELTESDASGKSSGLYLNDNEPSAQPERKTGKWLLAEDGWYCSVCELYVPFDCDPEEKGIPYCPYCGAKMTEEQ